MRMPKFELIADNLNVRIRDLIKLACLMIFLLSSRMGSANDIMGADISYRCLGNDSFEFTCIVYKDCNANWQIPAGVYNLSVSANSCTMTPFTVSPQLISCVDITPICDGYCTKCNSTCNSSTSNSTCSFPYGIEKLTFRAIVYLGNTSCCDFHIGYIGNSTRNTATTTCCNTDLFYTYVEMNKCVTPCNSSPIFTNDPVGILCAGQDFVFNNGALDTLDGDSMTFELAPALRAKNNSASYYGNFGPTKPLTFLGFPNTGAALPAGFHLDPLTGDLAFRPNQANQIAVIVVKVKEWRKINGQWVVIGETRRDMQFIIIACANNAVPEISPPTVFNACAGQQICVDILTNDDNANDTVQISWNRGIPGATFTNNNGTVKHAKGKVCWTPSETDVSNIPYTFTVKAEDNACPIKGQSIRSFSIFVRETPEADMSYDLLSCGRIAMHYVPEKTYPGFNATWVIRDENLRPVYSSNNQTYDTTQLQPGKYQITLSYHTNTPCYNLQSDTFEITDYVTVKIPGDTALCPGDSLFLDALVQGGSAPYTMHWEEHRIDGETDRGNAEDIWVKPDTTLNYLVRVEDATGCTNFDSIHVVSSIPPPVDLGPDLKICKGDFSMLDAGNDSMTLKYFWVTGDTNRVLKAEHNFNYWVRVTDSLGCTNYDTLDQEIKSIPLSGGPDKLVCEGDTITLSGTGASSYQWYHLSGFSVNPLPPPIGTNQDLTAIINQGRGYVLRGIMTFDTLQCAWLDTITVSMNAAPAVNLGTLGPYCPDGALVNLIQAVQPPTQFNGTWTSVNNPQSVQNGLFNPALAGTGNHILRYTVTDTKGCKGSKNLSVQVLSSPSVLLKDSLTVCGNEVGLELNAFKISPANYTGLNIDWYEANQNAQFTSLLDKTNPGNTILRLNGQLPQGTYKVVLHLENKTNGCGARDTAVLRVLPVPAVDAGTIAPLCWNADPVNLNAASGRTPAGGTWSSTAPLQGVFFDPEDVGASKRYSGDSHWMVYRYTQNGCTGSDSFLMAVLPLPQLTFADDSFCMDDSPVNLSNYSQPGGAGSVWTGTGVSGNLWDLNTAGKGVHLIHYDYTAPNGCENETDASLYVEVAPEITVVIPDEVCEGERIDLQATLTNTTAMLWTSDGDGLFQGGTPTSTQPNTSYEAGGGDVLLEAVTLHAATRQNSACPEATVQKQVLIHPLPALDFTIQPPDGCEPLDIQLEATTDAPAGSLYEWDLGNGQNRKGDDLKQLGHTYTSNGTFPVRLKVTTGAANGGCTVEAGPKPVEVFPKPLAQMEAESWMRSSNFPGVQFYDRSVVDNPGLITEWEWQFDDPQNGGSTLRNPYYEFELSDPSDTNNYRVTLKVTTDDGCVDTTGRWMVIIPEISVFIPNAFTPDGNGPGTNNRFVIVAENYKSIRVSVFNRWGEQVFYTEKPDESWDGTYKGEPVQQDVYMYIVEIESIHGKVYRYSGTLTVLP